ncbi:MAG TPA: hypothetical protein VFQ11_13565 [Nocardioidaceae bacterium]|nr:hypothetical protein [Nocardioidaceae bacterium]
MTNRPGSSCSRLRARRAARLLALVPAALVTMTAGAAVAAPPDSWENTPHVSTLHVLLVLGAIPLALIVIITLLVYLPSMAHRQRTGEAWRGEPTWFGGPRGGLDAVDKAEQPALTDGGSDTGPHTGSGTGPSRGGDSGRW